MTRLVVEMLGGLRVTTATGREIRVPSRKARALLACLALRAGAPVAREHLAGLLWDDSDAELARASLRQALASLRRSLGEDAASALSADTSSLALDPALATSDVEQFRILVRDGSPRALADAAARYSGELLPGFEARSAAFDAWIEEQRRALRHEWSRALQRSASQCLATGDLVGAAEALARLVVVEPANEAAQRELMTVYSRQGRHTEALRQYRACVDALRRDLDVAPEPATEAVHREILRRRRATAPAPSEAPAAREPPGVPTTTLREAVVLAVRIGRSGAPDPETLREGWTRAEAGVRATVSRLGGAVDRPSQGELIAAFGLAGATGNEAEHALRAAAALTRAAIDPSGPRLAIGIARGLVLPAGREDPFPVAGQPVSAAQDLARVAALDSVLVAADIAAQVDGRYAFAAGGAGAPAGARVLLRDGGPAAARAGESFAGRRAELAMIETLFERVAASRRGRAVVVRGEAGIGKSSLLEALARVVRPRATVHVVQVLDFGQTARERPRPVLATQLLGLPPGSAPDACRAAIERAVSAGELEPDDVAPAADLLALEPLGPQAALLATMDDAARESGRMRVLARLIARAARDRALAIVVEDVHWADAGEIAQLADLAGSVATLPVLLALSTRADGDPLTAAWRARARGCPVTTLDLAPLADDEARELATRFGDIPGEVLEHCLDTAAGNPLFLVQLLRSARSGQDTLPGSVRALLLARVERLAHDAQRALHAAAVLGPRFSLDALRHVAAAPDWDPAELQALGLVSRDGDDGRFAHALIRDAIYETLLRSSRRALHQRAAHWFEPRDLALCAEHLAAAGDPAAAAAHLRAAAAEQRACRFDRALLHAERARALATSDHERGDASAELGAIHLARGRTEEALLAYHESVALATAPGPRARARLGLATSLRVVDRYDEALEVLRLAEDDATAEGDPRRLAHVWNQRGNLHFPRGELEQCLRAHQRSLELAEGAGSPEDVARAHGGLCDAEYQRGRMRSALGHVLRCLELAAQHRLGTLHLAYLPMAAACRKYCGEFAAAHALAQQAATAAQQAGDLRAELVARSVGAMLALYRTEFAAALEGSTRSVHLACQIGARRFEIEARVLTGLAHHGLGADGEALAILAEAAGHARAEAATYCAPWALAALALVQGSPAEGRCLLEEGRRLLQRGSVSHNHLELHAIGIEFSLRVADVDGALRHAADLATYTRDEPLPWADLVIERAAALVAAARSPGDGATVEALRRTLQRAEDMGFRALVPRLEAALGPGG